MNTKCLFLYHKFRDVFQKCTSSALHLTICISLGTISVMQCDARLPHSTVTVKECPVCVKKYIIAVVVRVGRVLDRIVGSTECFVISLRESGGLKTLLFTSWNDLNGSQDAKKGLESRIGTSELKQYSQKIKIIHSDFYWPWWVVQLVYQNILQFNRDIQVMHWHVM